MTEQQREFIMPKKSKVAIVGCADSKDEVDFSDLDCEFWGVNNLYLTMPKPWSRWFDLHTFSQDVDGKWLRRGAPDFRGQPIDQYLAGMQALNIPVYMQNVCAPVPNAVIFPINEILQAFGNYFTNTISYMIALAIADGFKEIRVYGVDMAVNTEYSHQRPSCEYFLGVAAGRGIKIYIPDSCDLLKTRFLYGFHEVRETAYNKKIEKTSASMKTRREQAAQKLEAHKKQAEFFQRQIYEYNGAIAAIEQSGVHWGNACDMWPKAEKGAQCESKS